MPKTKRKTKKMVEEETKKTSPDQQEEQGEKGPEEPEAPTPEGKPTPGPVIVPRPEEKVTIG